MKSYDPAFALDHLRFKYYKTLARRIAAKAGHLEKPLTNKKLIASLRAEIDRLSFKFRSVFDSSRSYYIILDRDMNVVDFNRASFFFVKRLFGKRMVIGDHILDFLHPSSAKMITENCQRAFAGEKVILERKIIYTDKVTTWWQFEFTPATNLKGRIKGLVFNANDITKRKAYEENIRMHQEKLVDISAMQSHEIRGPVCTIMGLMSLIKEGNHTSDKEYLRLMEISADLLDKNIHEIVDLANNE